MNHFDFSTQSTLLLSKAILLVNMWIPGGRQCGCEYIVKNPTREDKNAGSFKINTRTGEWADFSTGDKGGDLISLYAYINGISNGEAARKLSML